MQLYEAGVSARAAAEVAAVATSSEQKQQSDARQTHPFKPVEHYTQQLQRALADAGINFKSVPRNQWPKEVMVKLYRQMAESAPRSVFMMRFGAAVTAVCSGGQGTSHFPDPWLSAV
jgi:hypothetical protein